MSVFRDAPVGAVSRAYGITAVRRSAPPPQPPTGGTPIGAAPDDDYPLAGLLRCAACQLRLRPVAMLGGRAYGAPCGCRLTAVAADVLERLVFDAVVAREPAARDCEVAADTRRCWAALFRRHLAEVHLGGTPDDLSFVWIV